MLSANRSIIIESFESGNVPFTSWQDEDLEPESYYFSTDNTANPYSVYSLAVYGNTWKVATIEPITLQENSVWQIDVFCENVADIQGFGLFDGENTLFYSFFGTEMLNIEEWVPVYQGVHNTGEWITFLLPVADDWFAWYEEYPIIQQIIFLNDADDNPGIVYFDDVLDVSSQQPIPPDVEVYYSVIGDYRDEAGQRNVTVQFSAEIIDPDSDSHVYYWDFGDGYSSMNPEPEHTYLVEDNHLYTVLLSVVDDTQKWGYGSCNVPVEPGSSTLPVKMNFIGDVMLARSMQSIINNFGMETIFSSIDPYLGQAADITIANLESPFTNSNNNHPTKTIYFKADPANIAAITHAGIDVACLANNHIWDYMNEGMLDTQQLLYENQIAFGGAGINSYEAYLPHFENRSGINIAFLFSSDRTGQYNNYQPYLQAGLDKPGFAYMTPYYVSQQIAEVQNVADVIVVNTHSGSEYSTAPGANYDSIDIFAGWDERDFAEDEDYTPRADIPHMWDIEIRHHFIDQGADIVICHHPHVIQGLEIYNGKLIAHSLGNFVFDLTYSETFPSMILNMNVNENGLSDYSITPVFIDDFIPKRAEGELGLHILEYLVMKSRDLNTYLKIDRENIVAEVIIDTLNMISQTNEFILQTDLQVEDDHFISPPVRFPELGYASQLAAVIPQDIYHFRLGRELVWNGNFEDEGSSEWNLNSDYEWLDNAVYYNGDYSLCLNRESWQGVNVVTDLSNRLKRFEDSQYTVHGYIKTENVSASTIQIRCYSNRTGGGLLGIGELNQTATGTSDWQYYHGNLDFEEGTNFFNINASLAPPDEGESFAWFDDIGLIEWTTWQDYNGFATNIWNPNNYRYIQLKSTSEITYAELEVQVIDYNNPLVQAQENPVPPAKIAEMNQNYPNPFNPETIVSFNLTTESTVFTELTIYNIKGQKVRTLANENLPAGEYEYLWNGKNDAQKRVASGIYFISLQVNKKVIATRKCLLLK